jgi:hypothetical protein
MVKLLGMMEMSLSTTLSSRPMPLWEATVITGTH